MDSATASLLIVATLGALVIAYVLGRPMLRARRRRRRATMPFPAHWEAVLRTGLPLYPYLPDGVRERLHGVVHNLLAEKTFVGCAGLEVTDNMRLAIAAQAALLQLKPDAGLYPTVHSILVYPEQFFVEHETRDEAGVHSHQRRLLSGESWEQGKIVVSWNDVLESVRDPGDGYNVVLHEFAHALDHEDGAANGLPPLPADMDARRWQQVMSDAYARLCQRVEHDGEPLIDPYGTESPAEFFAVVTETFFELPAALAEEEPQLYRELVHYYGVDPAGWRAGMA